MLLIVFLIISISIMFYLCFYDNVEPFFSEDTNSRLINKKSSSCIKTTDCTECISSSVSCQWNENKKDCSSKFGNEYSSICPINQEPVNSGIIYHKRNNKKRKEKKKN